MAAKPTYEELKQKVAKLEQVLLEREHVGKELLLKENIIMSSSSVIATCDLEGKMTYGNPAFLEIWGFDDAKEFLGRHFSEFWVVKEMLDEIVRTLQSEGQWFGEIKARRKDGTLFDAQILAATVYDAEGRPVALTSTSIDITGRKLLEGRIEQLNYLKEKLLGTADLNEKLGIITDGIVEIFKADFARVWLTRPGDLCDAGCIHAGVTEGPHVCRYRDHCLHLMASSGRYTHIDGDHRRVPFGCYKIGRVAAGDNTKFLTNDVANDPRIHDRNWASKLGLVSFVGYRLLAADGKVIGILALFSKQAISSEEDAQLEDLANATAQVIQTAKAQELLRESEARYRLLIDNLPNIVFTGYKDWSVNFIDDQIELLTGYKKEEFNSYKIKWIDLIVREDLNSMKEIFIRALKTDKSYVREYRIKKRNGDILWLQEGSQIVCNQKGEIEFITGAFLDITERRRLEYRLQQAQKMEAISTLAGGIAHQFNNALTGITGNISLLQLDLPGDENIRKYIEPMKVSAQRMANLSDQLLAYARGGKYQPKTISINQFLADTLPVLKHIIDPDISVETDFSKDILNIRGDLTQMQMVLSDVLINSSEAIDGRGRIRIATRLENVDKEFAFHYPGLKPGPHICLTIDDDGKGMDLETRSRIFEPFFTTKFQGRGLGLASVYGIVKNHDGWISVDSELGVGTVVRIYLPAVDVQIQAVEMPKIEPRKDAGTILLIEDEEVIMDVGQAMLERLGYRVLVAKNGSEAVSMIKTFEGDIDLALLDIQLPDMEGGKVYPLIKDMRPDLKVIVCSGYSIDGPAREILKAGAQGFIQKPFSLENLSIKLKEVLEDK